MLVPDCTRRSIVTLRLIGSHYQSYITKGASLTNPAAICFAFCALQGPSMRLLESATARLGSTITAPLESATRRAGIELHDTLDRGS